MANNIAIIQALLGGMSDSEKATLIQALTGGSDKATNDTSVATKAVETNVVSGGVSGVVVKAPTVVVDTNVVVDKVAKEKPVKKGKLIVAYRINLRDSKEGARKQRVAGGVEYLTERQVQMTINTYTKKDSEKASAINGIIGGTLPEYTNVAFIIRPLSHIHEADMALTPELFPDNVEITIS